MGKHNNGGRSVQLSRQTGETKVELALNLDGSGKATCETGVGFFNHMLDLLARHSLIDLTVHAEGDLDVDAHHTVEDVGIVRSEEHTSELQSQSNLVCRLLLEKKKQK